jgi:hypothetical protein
MIEAGLRQVGDQMIAASAAQRARDELLLELFAARPYTDNPVIRGAPSWYAINSQRVYPTTAV